MILGCIAYVVPYMVIWNSDDGILVPHTHYIVRIVERT